MRQHIWQFTVINDGTEGPCFDEEVPIPGPLGETLTQVFDNIIEALSVDIHIRYVGERNA